VATLNRIDPATAIAPAAVAYRAAPDTGEPVPSYMLGEVGIELLRWRLTGAPESLDRLAAAIRENIPNPTNESLWAAPGTMVAAWHLWRATGGTRWRDLFADNVEQVWRTWQPDAVAGFDIWTQDLYGRIVQLLGAGHGYAGNVFPLLLGAELLDDARRAQLVDRCAQALSATALRDGEAVNWPPGVGPPRPGRSAVLLQWCHGAPGIVTALGPLPVGRAPALEALLAGGGLATWQAGPLGKGYGLCHGTAGNGVAFLTLYRRSGDDTWLARARAFAMHAIAQRQRMREQHGVGRYTLWTGDAGLAVYLWQCLHGVDGMPALDWLAPPTGGGAR